MRVASGVRVAAASCSALSLATRCIARCACVASPCCRRHRADRLCCHRPVWRRPVWPGAPCCLLACCPFVRRLCSTAATRTPFVFSPTLGCPCTTIVHPRARTSPHTCAHACMRPQETQGNIMVNALVSGRAATALLYGCMLLYLGLGMTTTNYALRSSLDLMLLGPGAPFTWSRQVRPPHCTDACRLLCVSCACRRVQPRTREQTACVCSCSGPQHAAAPARLNQPLLLLLRAPRLPGGDDGADGRQQPAGGTAGAGQG